MISLIGLCFFVYIARHRKDWSRKKKIKSKIICT